MDSGNEPDGNITRTDSQIEALKLAYELWANESIVKTEKLTFFVVGQSVLLTGYGLAEGTVIGQPLIAAIGVLLSFLSFISMGRTDAFQKKWQDRVEELTKRAPDQVAKDFDLYPTREEISEMAIYHTAGRTYILYPPAIATGLWTGLLIYAI